MTKKTSQMYCPADGPWFPKLVDKTARSELRFIQVDSPSIRDIGRVLVAHLCVEHYLTRVIERNEPKVFDFEKVRLTFSQKVALLSGRSRLLSASGLLPGIRCLNAVRNKLSHDIEAQLTKLDVEPMMNTKVGKREVTFSRRLRPVTIIRQFSMVACGYLAGYLSGQGSVHGVKPEFVDRTTKSRNRISFRTPPPPASAPPPPEPQKRPSPRPGR